MIHLFIFSLCCSLAITAIHIAITREGMILNWITDVADKLKAPELITKPLFDCMACMASLWGSFFYWLFYAGGYCFKEWLFAILVISGINILICSYLENNTDYGC